MSQYLVELEKRQLVQQIASEQRQEAARVALKDDLKAAQAASEQRQQAGRVTQKADMQEALKSLEISMKHSISINNLALVALCFTVAGFAGSVGSWVGIEVMFPWATAQKEK